MKLSEYINRQIKIVKEHIGINEQEWDKIDHHGSNSKKEKRITTNLLYLNKELDDLEYLLDRVLESTGSK